MRIRRLAVLAAAGGALLVGLLVPPALSTPGSGATASVVARGTGDTKIRSHEKKYDVVVQSVTIQPGGHSGWHSHPGQAIVVVRSGTFTTYAAPSSDDDDDDDDARCRKSVFAAGSVYVDPGRGNVHIARNEGSTPLEVTVTYLDVPVGGAFRIDEAAPKARNCPA